MSFNEFGVVIFEMTEHFEMENPTAKSYLVLVTRLMAKVLYLMLFRTLFWRPIELMDMLDQILHTSLTLKRFVLKSIYNDQKFLYLYVGLLFICRLVLHIIWFIDSVILKPILLQTFKLTLYKVLITRFRNRFWLPVSKTYTYHTLDYLFLLYEAWIINVSALMWIFWDVIVAAILPITFQVTVRMFEEILRSNSSNSSNSDSHNSSSVVFQICRLFEMLQSMSKSINKVWGNICLVLVIYRSTTYAVNMNGWNKTEDMRIIIETTIPFVSLCLLLYLSGDVYNKVSKHS